MIRNHKWAWVLVLLSVSGAVVLYQSGAIHLTRSYFAYPDESVPDLHVIEFYSHEIDQPYRLYVQVPHGYNDTEKRYPVMYATDGGSGLRRYRDVVLPLLRTGRAPEMICVGIGLVRQDPIRSLGARNRDLSVRHNPNMPSSGGADRFLDFVTDCVAPFIDATYRTVPDDRGLAGHSLGGFFTMYVAFAHTDSFNRYIASSPSLFFDGRILFDLEEELSQQRSDLPISLYVSVATGDAIDMRELWAELRDILDERQYDGFRFKAEKLSGFDHGSVIPHAFRRGLAFVYGDY